MSSIEEKNLANCVTIPRFKKAATPKTPTKPKAPAKPKKPRQPKKPTTVVKHSESPPPKPKRKKAETKKVTKEPDRKLLVAVDFGTTFSGIAWAQTRKPDVRTIINQWPEGSSGLEGRSSDKVPTEIVYDGDECKWGFQIKEYGPRSRFFKLDLDPSQKRDSPLASKYVDPTHALPDHDPEKLTTDFLRAIRRHVERVLRHSIPETALLSTPIEYIITVPAVWSDMAQAKTRACADAAGMGTGAALHMISEPEAAALYALDALDPHDLKIGDTLLAEANPGSGSLCGASYLNRGFQEFLVEKLGNEPGWDEEVMEDAMKRFEVDVKRRFQGTVGEDFQIPVPGLQDNKELRIRKNKMTMSGDAVRAIFEPVVNEVLKLVTGQINAAKRQVKFVILVGGFGQNAFLRDAIGEEVKPSGVKVLQSPNSWTAVVRGALMKGLASTSPAFATVGISERSARKHYGLNCGTPYLQLEHGSARKIWDACSGIYRTYMMEWFIEKGNSVKEGKPVRLSYQQKRLVSRGPFKTISTAIYHSSDPQNSGAPKYVEDESVTPLVNVQADLSRIPANKIPQTKGVDGKRYYKIDYVIQVTYLSAYTSYELIYGGVNYGHVTSEYV